MSENDPERPEKEASGQGAGLNTRFLWVLLGVMIGMVALPLLPETGRNIAGGVLAIWLAYEFWLLVYKGISAR